MPKAAMDPDGKLESREDNVRAAGEMIRMQPEAVAEAVELGTHKHLGDRVLPSDRRHDAPPRWVYILERLFQLFLQPQHRSQRCI